MNKPTFKQIAVVALIASLAFSFGLVATNVRLHQTPQVTANVYFYEGSGADAKLIAESGNLITDFGEETMLEALVGNATDITGIAAGNSSTIDQTDTGLDTEATDSGFDRVACNVSALWSNSGDSARNFTASFDATVTISVNSVILTLSTVSETADAMATSFITDGTQHQFPLSTPASRLTVVWVLTVNAN